MKQSMNLKVSQHLRLTPQLQQSIRLLQLSTVELEQELEQAVSQNPLLEREESGPFEANSPKDEGPSGVEAESPASTTSDEPLDLDWTSAYSSRNGDDDEDEPDFTQQASDTESLSEHLMTQLAAMRLSSRDKSLVELLIAMLDERGYLSEPLEEIAAALPPELDIDEKELDIALKHLQNMEPSGVAARTPAECLELQLKSMPGGSPEHAVAIRIVREHLSDLAARNFARLKRTLRCSDECLRRAHQLILSLNPYPGSQYARTETHYIVPDVVVSKSATSWIATINPDALPKLRINPGYAQILRGERNAGAMSAQLQEARWLIRNVQQRFDTILRVAQAIVAQQRHFFDHGEVAMRPLLLREIADTLHLHESTISRVTRQKYMATPRGIFELKYFFGSQVTTESGGSCSATAIRALLRQLVSAEDRARPLSDHKIASILGEQGIMVARRTIAKYRESMRVPPMSQRVSL